MREIRIPGLRRVLRISWSASGVDRDIEDEIGFHLDARTEELVRLGIPRREARERAQAEYGDVAESRRELTRVDRRRVSHESQQELLMSLRDDLRYAARGLVRRPTLLVVTTLTLSLGIAANSIVFGIVDQLLLRAPAGIIAPDAVKRIYFRELDGTQVSIGPVTTYPVLTALRANTPAFSELAAYGSPNQVSLGRGRERGFALVPSATSASARSARLTAAASGNRAATSGASTTTFVPSR